MRQRFLAQNGHPGAGRNRDGAAGSDVTVEVPPGTMITDLETDERLLDLLEEGQEVTLLTGGRGGKGNAHFKTAHNQTPRFSQPGEEGEERRLKVELKVIADVGFVGLPNAGKSTLLKVLTAADPKIGNYPFTTIIPNLGVMHHHQTDIVLADIPGLIEGAASGAGLGIQFLKHVARTRGIAFVIDAGDADPAESLRILRQEMRSYSRDLLKKRALVIITKTDRLDSEEVDRAAITQFQAGSTDPVVQVSALTRSNLDALRDALATLAGTSSADGDEGGESAP
jgi:GTPase